MRFMSIATRYACLVAALSGAVLSWPLSDQNAKAQSPRSWVDPPAERAPNVTPAPAEGLAEPKPSDAGHPTPTNERHPEQVISPAEAPSSPREPSLTERPHRAAPAARPEQKDVAPGSGTKAPLGSTKQDQPHPDRDAAAFDKRAADTSEQAAAAKELATAYLDFWSAPNAIMMEATPEFYASQVQFHGRTMKSSALFKEKRQFARRWPVRNYQPRLNTMRATCASTAAVCTVWTTFDFTAHSPQTGKVSQGVAILNLEVSFSSGRPVIVAESSRVTSRAPGPQNEAFYDGSEDQ